VPQPEANTPNGRIADKVLVVDKVLVDKVLVVQDHHFILPFGVFASGCGTTIIGPIMQELQQMQQQQQQMQQQLQVLVNRENSDIMIARATNNAAVNINAAVMAVPRTSDLQVPDPFPATLQELQNLNSADVNRLLAFYGDPVVGSLALRRSRIMARVGARLPV